MNIDILEPQTQFEDRVNQVDVRLNKTFQVGRYRIQGMLDVYNLFNASSITGSLNTYGPSWGFPTQVLGARLFKLGTQIDF